MKRDASIEELKARIVGLEQQLKDADNATEAKVPCLQINIGQLEEKTATAEATRENLVCQLEETQRQAEKAEDREVSLSAQLNKLQEICLVQRTQIGTLEPTKIDLEHQVGVIEASLADVTHQVEKIEGEKVSLSSQLIRIQEKSLVQKSQMTILRPQKSTWNVRSAYLKHPSQI